MEEIDNNTVCVCPRVLIAFLGGLQLVGFLVDVVSETLFRDFLTSKVPLQGDPPLCYTSLRNIPRSLTFIEMGFLCLSHALLPIQLYSRD